MLLRVRYVNKRQNLTRLIVTAYLLWQPIIAVVLAIIGVSVPALLVTTSLAAACSFIFIVQQRNIKLRLKNILRSFWLIIFFAIVFVCQLWSIAPISATQKAELFLIAAVIPSSFIILSSAFLRLESEQSAPEHRVRIKWISVALCLYVGLFVVFAFPSATGSGRMVLPGIENPIWVSRFAATFLVIMLFRYHQSPSSNRLLWLVFLTLITGYVLIQTNSRGVILSLVAAGIYVFQKNLSQLVFRLVLVTLVAGLITTVVDLDQLARGYYSINERLKYFDFILSDPIATITGRGLASFGKSLTGFDIYLYPHNIILEIWFELGLLALCVFLFVVYKILFKFHRSEYKAVFIFFLSAAMFSGDIAGNSQVFYLAAVLLVTESS